MKKYDFAKARDFIEAEKEILASASLGMHEDWFWTALGQRPSLSWNTTTEKSVS